MPDRPNRRLSGFSWAKRGTHHLGSGVVTGNDGQTIIVTYNGAHKITRVFYNDTFFKVTRTV